MSTLCAISNVMTLDEALATLRTLNLDRGRLIELTRQVATADDDTERRRILYRARAEEAAAIDERAEVIRTAWADRSARVSAISKRAAQQPLDSPERPVRRTVDPVEPRPVTVRHIAPQPPKNQCPEDHAHGASTTCYSGHLCRCADCRAGNSERAAAYRRGERPPRPEAKHGLYRYKKLKCRCDVCKDAKRQENADRTARRQRDKKVREDS